MEDTYTDEKIADWKERLATVFNRGFWDGYYLGRKMGEWNDSYGSKATRRKIYIGRGLHYYDQIGVGEFKLESHDLRLGDTIMITGPTTGYVELAVDNLRIDNVPNELAKKGDVITFPVAQRIRPSDKLYKLVDA